jgi:hypothetical protein
MLNDKYAYSLNISMLYTYLYAGIHAYRLLFCIRFENQMFQKVLFRDTRLFLILIVCVKTRICQWDGLGWLQACEGSCLELLLIFPHQSDVVRGSHLA